MKIFIKGVGSLNLTKNNYVAQGGEGSIYAKGDTAYKIYADPKKMIPTAKIGELEAIQDKSVIRPINILLDQKNKPIGYSMRYIQNTHALCQLFTKSFKDRNRFTPDMSLNLVRDMQKTIQHIHDKRILIVDLNEMNFLINDKFKEVYFIDVDSYQTKSFPATAIMESIRDRHSKTFNEGTDWFSFAVVSFQLFIGIHPYKGKYKQKGWTIDDRMHKNISVFNKDVKLPRICASFDMIPEVYRNWYRAVFEKGERLTPPFDLNAKVNVIYKIQKIKGNNKFDIVELFSFDESITDYIYHDGTEVISLANNTYVNKFKHPNNGVIAFTPKMNYVISTSIKDGLLRFYNLTLKKEVTCSPIQATKLMSYEGRVYSIYENNVLEIEFSEMQNSVLAHGRLISTVLPQSSKMYNGVVFQNLFGSFWASFFPKAKTCQQCVINELDSYEIVDAKFDRRVLMVVGTKKGKYDKYIFQFSSDYGSYTTRKIKDISILEVNFTTLENGVVAHINDNENLELFAGSNIKEIESDVISSDMKLYKRGTKVLFSKDKELYSLTMRK